MYNIGICDDGKGICASLEEMVQQYAKEKKISVETMVWYTAEKLCSYLAEHNDLDILFLDIALFEMTGIQAGDFIRNRLENWAMQIVYISAKPSYAMQLFKIQPLDFLVKPILQTQIDETLGRAIKVLERGAGKFEFQAGKDLYAIPFRDILCFVSERRKIKVVAAQGQWEFYGRMKDILPRLPGSFLTIHQSYVVNKEHVFRYTYDTVELRNGMVLSISKANRKRVREDVFANH